ncbi:hypothetical protein KA005_82420, partial [bacterium]|nr:hypothetical protein [bacterium]
KKLIDSALATPLPQTVYLKALPDTYLSKAARPFTPRIARMVTSSRNRISARTERVYRENPDVYKGKTQLVFCSFVR